MKPKLAAAAVTAFAAVGAWPAAARADEVTVATEPSVEVEGSLPELEALLEGLLPGDERTASVSVSNQGPQAVQVRLAASGRRGEREQAVADAATVSVRAGGSEVFRGTLSSLLEGGWSTSLGELGPGASTSAEVSASIPAELGNEFAMDENPVLWTVEAQADDLSQPATPLPQTGVGLPGGFLAAALALAAAFVALGRLPGASKGTGRRAAKAMQRGEGR